MEVICLEGDASFYALAGVFRQSNTSCELSKARERQQVIVEIFFL
jgi:hypothetical protein